jgi:hypothetical protein
LENKKLINKENLYINCLAILWDRAKHNEMQRLQLFYFHVILTTAIISASSIIGFSSYGGLLLLYFLFLFSLTVYHCDLKWNTEFSACIATMQWICEELELIKVMEDKNKEKVKAELGKLGHKGVHSWAFFKDAYFHLNLPVSIRVHEWAFTKFPGVLTVFSFALSNALLIHLGINILETGLYIPILDTMINMGVSFFVFLISAGGMSYYCYNKLRKIRKESNVWKVARKPNKIKIWSEKVEKI